jgi:hypothetical protein
VNIATIIIFSVGYKTPPHREMKCGVRIYSWPVNAITMNFFIKACEIPPHIDVK